MHDALILSDLHLGAINCEAGLLSNLLADVEKTTRHLVIAGDLVDHWKMNNWPHTHRVLFDRIVELAWRMPLTWIEGNHEEGPVSALNHGIASKEELVLESGGVKVLVLHGHQFDDFLDAHPLVTHAGDQIYRALQWVDQSHSLARLAKHACKSLLHVSQKVARGAVALARTRGCDAAVCGHTHLPGLVTHPDGFVYANAGCWTERPATYLVVKDAAIAMATVGRGRRHTPVAAML